jgi:NTE family protein
MNLLNKRPKGCSRIALVFQGGGALGAYQAGVYQAMDEAGVYPDWVCGVSIGGINSAIIAGNPQEKRVEKLREFWETVTTPHGAFGYHNRRTQNKMSSLFALLFGQKGFFTPRQVNPWLLQDKGDYSTSFYDTTDLKNTLNKLIDFDLLMYGPIDYACGAVNVMNGNFVYFNNRKENITVEHVMASGALPPAFPMVKIGYDYYWDGGIVSNTPLKHLLNDEKGLNTLVFQVDLFSSKGDLPKDIPDVLARHKDIMYSSRTRANTDTYRRLRRWKEIAYDALLCIPTNELSEDQLLLRDELSNLPDITILQLIYTQKPHELECKDYDFSRQSMLDHWSAGYEHTKQVLANPKLFRMPDAGDGVLVLDTHKL